MPEVIEQPALAFSLSEAERASEAAIRVGHLLQCWQGLHHLDPAEMKRTVWTNPWFVSLKMASKSLASWDFNELTTLVFLAHDHCIRVDVKPAMRYLELMFHPRSAREGGMAERHPTLEQAVSRWRETHPAPPACPLQRAGVPGVP